MDEMELRHLMYTAQLEGKGSFVIRYPRGRGSNIEWQCPFEEVPIGKGRKLRDGNSVAILSIGTTGVDVEKAIDSLSEERPDISPAHYDMRFVKPIDEDILSEVAQSFKHIVTVEDGVRTGGFGTAVMEWLSEHGHSIPVTRLGLPDSFVEQGTVTQLKEIVGIDSESIKRLLTRQLANLFFRKPKGTPCQH